MIEIETKLGISVPPDYRQFMISPSGNMVGGMLGDANQIVAINERNRQMSWLGRPLESVFYIFAADKRGREIFMDLDIPGPVIMVADYERKCGAVQARTFQEWVSRFDRTVKPAGVSRLWRWLNFQK